MIALGIAGMVLALVLAGWFLMWDWRRIERRNEWWEGVQEFRADRDQLASGTLQLDYAIAVGHTLIRNEITTHDQLVAALDRRTPVLEVVA